MNRIILIGNGFDLAHGLRTSYRDFIDDFWNKEREKIVKERAWDSRGRDLPVFEDKFISITTEYALSEIDRVNKSKLRGYEWFKANRNSTHQMRVTNEESNVLGEIKFKNKFLERITKKSNLQNWVDIEQEYYNAVLECSKNFEKKPNDIVKLNEEFQVIKESLISYLRQFNTTQEERNSTRFWQMEWKDKNQDIVSSKPENILILSFNYTHIEERYVSSLEGIYSDVVHIHGELGVENNQPIFGYGDMIDKNYQDIEDLNDNHFLENMKSINYAETNNYELLEEFIDIGDYEVFVCGHSCGISDRTLLNKVFEDNHCKKIKICYFIKEDGTDNFKDVASNISRNFRDKAKFSSRLVDKQNSDRI
jgi:hypothetical protein